MRWMNLELVIQNKVGQKEKTQYSILTHIYGIYKNGTDECICREGMETHTDIEKILVDTAREGESRTN